MLTHIVGLGLGFKWTLVNRVRVDVNPGEGWEFKWTLVNSPSLPISQRFLSFLLVSALP